jgi:hypothetical protein
MWGGIIGLIIQVIAGAVGGNVAGTALKQYDLGMIGAAVWHRIREQPQSALFSHRARSTGTRILAPKPPSNGFQKGVGFWGRSWAAGRPDALDG